LPDFNTTCRDPETAVISGRQVATAAGRSVSRQPAAVAAASAVAAAAVHPKA